MSKYWQETLKHAKNIRHELHAYPELSWSEHRTAERIRTVLDELKIPWRPCAKTGTVAQINPHSSGKPHIALRGDIDALPITEQTNKPWQSTVQGSMHACGHDGHTATLLATASWLKHHEQSLPGPVTLLFQPAEEGGHGAREMIADGALEGVDAIYGWHNWPAIPFGKIVCPDGVIMSGNGTFILTLNGKGGHASQPELCRDPVLAASAVTLALQQVVSRRMPPQQACVLSVTSIEASSSPTVIPQQAVVSGSIRVPNHTVREQMNQLIGEVATQTAQSYGVNCEVDIQPRYNPTINHAQHAKHARDTWQHLFGDDSLDTTLSLPSMASEDFSYYLQEIPGAFSLIGADDGHGHADSCHSPNYDFNDRLISLVTQWYSQLVGAPSPDLQEED